jgi:hypothetical protein
MRPVAPITLKQRDNGEWAFVRSGPMVCDRAEVDRMTTITCPT